MDLKAIEEAISPVAGRYGLAIYDIEQISFGPRPMLRVFMERGAPVENVESRTQTGVSAADLEGFAKALLPLLQMKELMPREGRVEVSSPGIFRRLRRPGHFLSAVGELIGITVKNDAGKETLTAKLVGVTDDGIQLESDRHPFVPFAHIQRSQLQPEIKI